MSLNTENNTTVMEKIFSFLQLTGLVWNKKSVSSNILVVFWNIVVFIGMSFATLHQIIGKGSVVGIGMSGMMIAILCFTCLFHMLGTLTLGHLLNSLSQLEFTTVRRAPVNLSLIIFMTGSIGYVIFLVWIQFGNDSITDVLSMLTLYTFTLATFFKTVLITGSLLYTFECECQNLVQNCPSFISCQDMLKTYQILKLKIAPTFLGTFTTLTTLVTLVSYDVYSSFNCWPEKILENLPFALANIAYVVVALALMFYISHLTEDAFDAFGSVQKSLRF